MKYKKLMRILQRTDPGGGIAQEPWDVLSLPGYRQRRGFGGGGDERERERERGGMRKRERE